MFWYWILNTGLVNVHKKIVIKCLWKIKLKCVPCTHTFAYSNIKYTLLIQYLPIIYFFRKKFVCHHSTFQKVSREENKKGNSKNANCSATITCVIKLDTLATRKSDTFIKVSLSLSFFFIVSLSTNKVAFFFK